jgi:peptidyl-dipeptidase Dcp
MKKIIYLVAIVFGIATMTFFKFTEEMNNQENPFYSDHYGTPHNTPAFSKIKNKHYEEAFMKGMEEKRADIKAIIENKEEPNFENVIVAFEKSGLLLDRVSNVFYHFTGAHTNDTIKALSKKLSPLLTSLDDEIYMNLALFNKVKAINDNKANQDYTTEQKTVIENYYKSFVRSGANLDEAKKKALSEINTQLASICLDFGNNILDETNKFEMILEKEDLAGLSDDIVSAASATAKEHNLEGKYVFTIHKPSMIPFLTYSTRRDLRKQIYDAYSKQGDHDDELDNKKNLVEISNLRLKKANILGYPTHAHYVLDENMAKTPENVFQLLDKMWQPAIARAKYEVEQMQEIVKAEGNDFKIEAHDWFHYAEKVKMRDYALDEDMMRPYFKLENVIDGAFMVATKLYGLTFHPIVGIESYHDEAKIYEVKDEHGEHLAIYYADHHPRASKRGGAWMSEMRQQHAMDGKDERPLITNVMNFTKPTADKPSLLSMDETLTLFHEFGHAVHGMLSRCTYPSVAGTNTPRDFVEFPSQVFENWAMAPSVLKMYAKHYKTREPMPDELIEKIQKAGHFNQGFATVEYMAAAYLDMFYCSIIKPFTADVSTYEADKMKELGLIDEIIPRYKSTYFRHIFSSPTGYSSGYYGYQWAEVLDADTYEYFLETDLFDAKKAIAFRDEILAKGGTDNVMEMYKRFRGQKPKVEALIKKRGMEQFLN